MSNDNIIVIFFNGFFYKMCYNVMWLALSGVAPTPSHYKYNKTFHSAADFPKENPEVAIEANRCCVQFFIQFRLLYPKSIRSDFYILFLLESNLRISNISNSYFRQLAVLKETIVLLVFQQQLCF